MLALACLVFSMFLFMFTASPFKKNNKMLVSSCFSSPATAITACSDDESGFSDDDTTPITSIGIEIGHKLTKMCDDFDAELSSFRSRPSCSRSLLDCVLDFFSF